ncbi:unnamed protein product [marine sediment metagenome]|uniref:Exodeoxyribonuclease X-like C-terminal domain-containing protein n=1 Tax=marine sediment metagenome TaxID=412755 RepID=X0ZJ32_9ZZZZ
MAKKTMVKLKRGKSGLLGGMGGAPGPMPYAEAKRELIPFGKHEGETIDEVMDKDPSYLVWLVNTDSDLMFWPRFKRAMETYMNEPAVIAELKGG